MRADARTHGRTGAQGARRAGGVRRVRVAVALLALAVSTTSLSAQRAPKQWPRLNAARTDVRPQAPVAGRSSSGFITEVALGAIGSAGGAVGGLYLGRGICEATSPCGGEDPGLVEGFTGIIVGSIVGTAFGTHVGARVSGGRGGHFGARIGGALLGLLAAGGALQLAGGDADQTVVLVTLPIVLSLVTVLLTPRN